MTNEITMVPWRWGNATENMVHYLVYDKTEGWVVSMYLEGVGWFARGVTPCVDPSEDDLLHRVTHRSSDKLLGMGPTEEKSMFVTAQDIARAREGAVERSRMMDEVARENMKDVRSRAAEQSPKGSTHWRVVSNETSEQFNMIQTEYQTFTDGCEHLGWTKL